MKPISYRERLANDEAKRAAGVAECLKDYSDDALRAELRRRGEVKERERPKRFCDSCVHFNAFKGSIYAEIPRDWPMCKLGHPTQFMCPVLWAPYCEDWGFYRTGCKDFKKAPDARE
jgi:hypothetical protein